MKKSIPYILLGALIFGAIFLAEKVYANENVANEVAQINHLCTNTYPDNGNYAVSCIRSQTRAKNIFLSVMASYWPDTKEGAPVFRLVQKSTDMSQKIIKGKVVIDWINFSTYFKRDLQTLLYAYNVEAKYPDVKLL